jgi:hypothetical protein
MYFNFDGGVTFDEARYQRDLLNDAMLAEEREKLEMEDGAFDTLFGALEAHTEETEDMAVGAAE